MDLPLMFLTGLALLIVGGIIGACVATWRFTQPIVRRSMEQQIERQVQQSYLVPATLDRVRRAAFHVEHVGSVIQMSGSLVDVRFDPAHIEKLYRRDSDSSTVILLRQVDDDAPVSVIVRHTTPDCVRLDLNAIGVEVRDADPA